MATPADPFGLERFVEAQDAGRTFERAIAELSAGRKRSHWMWFVFPQLAGLGSSPTAVRYAISGRPEAEAYLRHPLLGERLRRSAKLVAALPTSSAEDVFGALDALKLRSSMTLFAAAGDQDAEFVAVLTKYFDGARDVRTLRALA